MVEKGVDLISSLPDEILQHILSSLQTTTAIKTSTLSKRWRHVWYGTHSLYLLWTGHDFKVDSLTKTLARYTASKMTSFHLYVGKDIESPHNDINRSIEFAVSKNVENMSLDIRSNNYNIPEFFYVNSSIKQLTLSLDNYSSDVDVPIPSVSWTSLKELSLLGCNFSDQCMAKILSGCPILESLSLDFCSELKVIDVSKSQTLRTLKATIRVPGTQIVAPHIRCLVLTSCVYLCTLVDVSSLTEANLETSVKSSEILTDGFPQVIMQMVEKLHNVETLTFGPNLLKILSVAELHHLPFPSFSVKDLKIETTISKDVIPGLVRLLQNSPLLKKLTVQPKLVNGTLLGKSLDDLLDVQGLMDSDQRWRKEARVFPNILSWHVEPKHVVSFIKLMLKTTKTLEKMVLKLKYNLQVEKVLEIVVPMLSSTVLSPPTSHHPTAHADWSKPPEGWLKCNVASSWTDHMNHVGGAWVARNSLGVVVFHSRRSFSKAARSLLSDLTTLRWAVEAMASLRVEKVVFETSSEDLRDSFLQPSPHQTMISLMVSEILQLLSVFKEWRLEHVSQNGNKVASQIATSVTRDRRMQSYVASGGPSWLQGLIEQEADAVSS